MKESKTSLVRLVYCLNARPESMDTLQVQYYTAMSTMDMMKTRVQELPYLLLHALENSDLVAWSTIEAELAELQLQVDTVPIDVAKTIIESALLLQILANGFAELQCDEEKIVRQAASNCEAILSSSESPFTDLSPPSTPPQQRTKPSLQPFAAPSSDQVRAFTRQSSETNAQTIAQLHSSLRMVPRQPRRAIPICSSPAATPKRMSMRCATAQDLLCQYSPALRMGQAG